MYHRVVVLLQEISLCTIELLFCYRRYLCVPQSSTVIGDISMYHRVALLQEISLYNELTIEELLLYFGRVYCVTGDIPVQRADDRRVVAVLWEGARHDPGRHQLPLTLPAGLPQTSGWQRHHRLSQVNRVSYWELCCVVKTGIIIRSQ